MNVKMNINGNDASQKKRRESHPLTSKFFLSQRFIEISIFKAFATGLWSQRALLL